MKHKFSQKVVSARSLAKEYNISKSGAHRILREDPKLHAYKATIEPRLTDKQKTKENKTRQLDCEKLSNRAHHADFIFE